MIVKLFWFLEDYLYKYEGSKANHFHQPPTDYNYEAHLSNDRLRPGSIPKQNSNCDFVFEDFSHLCEIRNICSVERRNPVVTLLVDNEWPIMSTRTYDSGRIRK